MITSKYFSESEFQRCTPSCSLQDMDQHTMDMFDRAREIAGIPFVIVCAYRTKAWDEARGRSGNGAHTKGYALDIRCNTNRNRWKIWNALVAAGFTRLGDGDGFVHADNDPGLPQNVIWNYYKPQKP